MPDVEFKHISVMPDEVIEGLDIKPGGIYVYGTMGGAVHGQLICERLLKLGNEASNAAAAAGKEKLGPGRYIGIDRDADAIKAGSERLKRFGDTATAVRSN